MNRLALPSLASAALLLLAPLAAASPREIAGYSPGAARPGEKVKILGRFPDRGKKQVRYGQGNATYGAVPDVRTWKDDVVKVVLPADMPPGTFWLGVANGKGTLKFKGPEALKVQATPPPYRMDTRDEGTLEGSRAQPVPSGVLSVAKLSPDLAITGFSGSPVVQIGETVKIRAVVTNRAAGTSPLPHYVYHRDGSGKVVRSGSFQVPKQGAFLQVPLTVFIDPRQVHPDRSLLWFRDRVWIGTGKDTTPGSYHDANDADNEKDLVILAQKP